MVFPGASYASYRGLFVLVPFLSLPLQVKAAFTRAYNKEAHLTPYSLQVVKKGRRGGPEAELGGEEAEQEPQEEEEEEEGMASDAMIKVRNSSNVREGKPLVYICQCLISVEA